MNISKEQKNSLKAWLNKQLKYREIFDEVYDHVLSALENAPEGTDFAAAYLSYINNEFGGEAGLKALERRNRRQIFNAMRQRYFNYIKEQLRFPAILMWFVLDCAYYLLFKLTGFNGEWYFAVYGCLSLSTAYVTMARYFKTGFLLGSTKLSVADEVFKWLGLFQSIVFGSLVLFSLFWGFNFITAANKITPFVATVFFTVYSLHVASVFKLYKHEFKVILAR